MQTKAEACQGHWKLWLTEIPRYDASAEELSLLPSGEAHWFVECRYKDACRTQVRWRIDDEGQLLLVTRDARVLSRCDFELSGDLMTLKPTHGHRSLYVRVAGACG